MQLFHAISTLNANHQPYVLQFTGSVPGEGVSTIASSFVQIAASQQGKPVLLIDCNAPATKAASSPSLIDAFHETGSINAAIQPAPGRPGIGLAQLSTEEDGRLNIDAGDLRKLFELAKRAFPIIVLDCPPACLTPESLALARFCDGTVLVIGRKPPRARPLPKPSRRWNALTARSSGSFSINTKPIFRAGWTVGSESLPARSFLSDFCETA